jgi:flavorubredoxin
MAKEPTYKEKVLAKIDDQLDLVVAEETQHEAVIEKMKGDRSAIDHKKSMLEDLRNEIEDMPMKVRGENGSDQESE